MLEYRLVGGGKLTHGGQDSMRHLVGGVLADSKHGGIFVHFARQLVGIDCERDRYRGHRAGKLAIDSRESRKQVHAPEMHSDSICVGLMAVQLCNRIANFVLEVGAKAFADRIGAMTVHQDAESGFGFVACRSRLRGKDQQDQGQHSD